MEDYNDIKELLQPKGDLKASVKLRKKVHTVLYKKHKNRNLSAWIFGGISLSAVAAILLIILIPSGLSAKQILSEAIYALENTENIEMVAEIRTRPMENFRYIDLEENFIKHKIEIVRNDSTLKWSINKGGRTAMNTGHEIYTWIPNLGLGWRIDNPDSENVLGYLASLLNPRDILETELRNCQINNGSEYKVTQNGEDIILTVHTPAQGNFENPYSLNRSITESENIRKYVIDAKTKRLISVAVNVISGKSETEVLKVDSIIYGNGKKNFFVPIEDIKFVEIESQTGGLTGLSAEEAASTILNAFETWNEKILHQVMLPELWENLHKEKFRESKLISIGNAFSSGIGSSVFVPYTLELSDGTVQRHNIALQKTNSGGWIVTGGI
ncbi:MAG: hypothetical protein J1F67_12285 [Muribaculaceae bacterium]|nr:hypothetical protein [Muribaculaceae bacterium]